MGNDWKSALANYFEELRILQSSKQETQENFVQFCEFIAEPAFESLEEEMKKYGLRTRTKKSKGKAITFQIYFSNTRIDNFTYTIYLPKNSLELEMKLRLRGRMTKTSAIQEREEGFLPQVKPHEVLNLEKSRLIKDVIEQYRSFTFEALASSE